MGHEMGDLTRKLQQPSGSAFRAPVLVIFSQLATGYSPLSSRKTLQTKSSGFSRADMDGKMVEFI
jgi:hypothetical protein